MKAMFKCLEWIGAMSLLFVMSLTVVDVFGRYLLNSPLPGSIELTRIGIAVVVFCALPTITVGRGHVCVDLFESRMAKSFINACDRLFLLFGAVGLTVIAWRMYQIGIRTSEREAVTEYLRIPFAYTEFFIAFMSAVTAISSLIYAFLPLEDSKVQLEQMD